MASDTLHLEDDRVAALHRLGVLDTPAEDRFDRVVRLARQLFGVSTAIVSLVDREVVVHKAMAGFDAPVVPREDSFCGTTVREDRMLVVPDAASRAAWNAVANTPAPDRSECRIAPAYSRDCATSAPCADPRSTARIDAAMIPAPAPLPMTSTRLSTTPPSVADQS